MFDLDRLTQLAKDTGFTNVGELRRKDLTFMQEVRDMCAADKCHLYNKSWACPPACGSIEECAAQAQKYSRGIVVQSTGELEDSFDIEGIEALSDTHKQRFLSLSESLRKAFPDMLPLGAGGCNLCETCTYPDAPCRFPDKAIPSMEAYGLLVSNVCERSNLPYYYGPNTLTYTSCFLIE